MATQQNFRTAFNGFNREDVVHYIEFLNSKHLAEINQLKSELEFLRSKLEKREEAAIEAPAADETAGQEQDALVEHQATRIRELFDEKNVLLQQLVTVRQEKQQLEEQLEQVRSEKQRTEETLTAVRDEKAQTEENLESALQKQNSFQSRMEEELEAYRRAERTERLARERAEQMYRQANGALADATGRVDEAAGQIGTLTDRVMAQLEELQAAVAGSKQALQDAAATMYTIRPTVDEE